MAEYDELFAFLEPGTDPERDRAVIDHTAGRTLLVWAPDGAAAARVAAEQAAAGVRLIELYRGFDLDASAQVIDAVAGRVPVGVATVGSRTTPRPIRRSVTIYASDPGAGRVVREHGDGRRTTVVAAADVESTVRTAVELASDVDLVEICGGAALTTAAAVARAVDLPVSLVGWPFESIDGAAAYKASFGS